MWKIEDAVNNVTNRVVIPNDGTITISKPDTVRVNAYINDSDAAIQQLNVKAGDLVYFKLTNYKKGETPIGFEYEGNNYVIMLPGKQPTSSKTTVFTEDGEPLAIISETTAADSSTTTEEEDMTPQDTINLFANPGMGGGGGAMGAGLGAGLVGGLLGTALFGRRGLDGLGGDGVVAAGGAVTASGLADMSLMQAIGQVDKAVAVSTASMEASQAAQSAAIVSQFNSVTSSLATRVDATKEAVNANAMVLAQQLNTVNTNIMATANETQKAVWATANETQKTVYMDGDKTRALIVQQYELNLQRQLADANAAIIELRGDNRLNERSRGIEVNTTNNINQMQQQQQQQAQYGQLAGLIYSLGQSIRNTDSAINVGSGTQTSTPTNTNTNIR